MIANFLRRFIGPDPAVAALRRDLAALQFQMLQMRSELMPDRVSFEFGQEFDQMPSLYRIRAAPDQTEPQADLWPSTVPVHPPAVQPQCASNT